MLTRTITIDELQQHTISLLGELNSRQEPMLIQRNGETIGVLLSVDGYRRMERMKADELERAWNTIDKLRERNAGQDPDEVLEFVTQIVEEVRQEEHERLLVDARRR